MNAKNYAIAYDKLSRACDLQPDATEYQMGAGMAAAKLGNRSAADKHFETAARHLSQRSLKDPEAVDDYALVLACLGRNAEAITVFKEGRKHFPNAPNLIQLDPELDEFLMLWAVEYGPNN